MATFNKFNSFIAAVAAGTHAGCLNADTDVLKVYLTNAAPSASADLLKADLAEIDMSNEANHGAGGGDVQNAATQATFIITVAGQDVTFLASGGSVGPFRYAVLYNDTAASDPLIGWWDRGSGSEVTLADGESFVWDLPATTIFTLGS